MEEKIRRTKHINAIEEVRGWEFVKHNNGVLYFDDKGDEIKVKFRDGKYPCVWRNDILQTDTLHDVFKLN